MTTCPGSGTSTSRKTGKTKNRREAFVFGWGYGVPSPPPPMCVPHPHPPPTLHPPFLPCLFFTVVHFTLSCLSPRLIVFTLQHLPDHSVSSSSSSSSSSPPVPPPSLHLSVHPSPSSEKVSRLHKRRLCPPNLQCSLLDSSTPSLLSCAM